MNDVPPRFGINAITVAGILLIGYLGLVVGTAYLGQIRLREAVAEQLRLGLEKRAAALTYFFAQRCSDVAGLARDRAIDAYVANRALGMSVEYGLGASLLNVEARLADTAELERLKDRPVYRRITYYDEMGRALADSNDGDLSQLHWESAEHRRGTPCDILVRQEGDQRIAFVAAPVEYKGRSAGTLVGEVDLDLGFAQLAPRESSKADEAQILLSPQVNLLLYPRGAAPMVPWQQLLASLSESQQMVDTLPGDRVLLRANVVGTPFTLAGIYSPVATHGQLISRWFLVALIGLAVPVLLGIAYLIRLNNRNLVLNASMRAALRQERMLSEQNVRLQREIRKREEYQRKLTYQANYDGLTGLPNRNLALDRLSQAIKRAQRDEHLVLVMYVDLDHFKHVNDSLGHAAGDAMLVQAANRLSGQIRDSDTVARLGGDEFLILCSDMAADDKVSHPVEAVLAAFEKPFQVEGNEFYVSTSIGVAVFPGDGANPQQLLKSADLALYQAKDAGRAGFCFFAPSMNARAQDRLVMERHLRRAIENNELEVLYQPLIELATGSIMAAEALLRWHSPELGEVSPVQFIPLAEEIGFIHDLGDWVLQQACRDAALWSEPRELRVAVNISSRQLHSPPRFLSSVKAALQASTLPPHRLELEITESMLLQYRTELSVALGELDAMGIRLSIDDFGTGYSALNYLRRFPFDVLKIDRSFVKDVLVNPASAALVRAIIAMADALSLEVVGEGVEEAGQAEFVYRSGCRFVQGFLFSRPVTAPTIQDMLSRNYRASF